MEHEHCGSCGFDGSEFDPDRLLAALHELGPNWDDLLSRAGSLLRERPAPGTWSAIEYAAHSRDITVLHLWGVEQALGGGEPIIPAVDDDLIESAAANYGDEDPRSVVVALADAANRMADLAADAGQLAWDRGITIGTSRNTVRRLLEHALHDSRHHVADVANGLTDLRGRPD